jgi:hypothetical protein
VRSLFGARAIAPDVRDSENDPADENDIVFHTHLPPLIRSARLAYVETLLELSPSSADGRDATLQESNAREKAQRYAEALNCLNAQLDKTRTHGADRNCVLSFVTSPLNPPSRRGRSRTRS